MAQLKIDQVRKSFGKTDVLKGVELDIADGEFIVLLGASGCGKSTLLRIIAGLDTQTSGHISIGGQVVDNLPPARRGIAWCSRATLSTRISTSPETGPWA